MGTNLFLRLCLSLGLALFLLSNHGWAWAEQGKYPDGFVDAAEVVPSAILDIRYHTDHSFVGEPIDGYLAPRCILTKQAAAALSGIQTELREFGLSLKIYDCYRPQRAVNHFLRWAKDLEDIRTKKEFYPTIDKKNLFRDGYIAEKSGHSRGSTVDLTIVGLPVAVQEKYVAGKDLRGCYLPVEKRFRDNSMDMGTGFDCFHVLSHPASTKVGSQQRMNRMFLKNIMEKHGYRNYDKEWWHFTLREEPFKHTYFDFPIE